ncbi:MAG: MFS transporter [Sporolactobacillus sp.]
MFQSLHRNIKLRLIISFLSVFVDNMIFPFMAMYFSQAFGPLWTGFLVLFNILVSSVSSLIGGYLSDRIGRKPMIVFAQSLFILSFAGMALANSIWWFSPLFTFFMLIIESLGSGLMHPAEEAMLIDVSDETNRRLMYSVNYWSTNLGMAGGAIIGGLFFGDYSFMLFLILVLVSLLIFGLIVFFMEEVYQRPSVLPTRPFAILSHYAQVGRDRLFLLFCLGNCLILSLEFQTTNAIAVHLQQTFRSFNLANLHLTSYSVLSWLRIENTLLVVLLAFFISKWSRKWSPNHIFMIGLPIYALGYALQVFSNQLLLLSFAVLLATIGELLYVPISQSLLASMTQEKSRAAYMAVYGFVFQGAKLLGAAGILIVSIFSTLVTGLLFILIGLLGMSCYLWICRSNKKTFTEKS